MLKQTEKNDSINRLWRKDGPLKQLLDLVAERIAAELHARQTDNVNVALEDRTPCPANERTR